MYIDIDIEGEIEAAVEDFLANGGMFATYDELEAVRGKLDKLEKELADLNFWKADRNHSHKQEDTVKA
jgi:hypothetical protein